MVSRFNIVFILGGFILLSIISCSTSDMTEEFNCSRENWLGTYSLTSSSCDQNYQGFDPLILTAGSGEGEVLFNGFGCTDQNGQSCNYKVSACTFLEHTIGDLTHSGTLEGEIFSLNVSSTNPNLSFSCALTYMKNE